MSMIIDNFLYLGSLSDVCTPSIINELQITHLINLSLTRIIPDESIEILHLPLKDSNDELIFDHIKQTNEFIEHSQKQSNGKCLVFCKHGRSRSVAIVIGYLINHHNYDVYSAHMFISKIRPTISVNRNYLKQLIKYSCESQQKNRS